MNHLKAFHIFDVAAESANFSEAADKLCITHGAVSKQIKNLEDFLSAKLFLRQGRKVSLTDKGRILKSYTLQSFQLLTTGVNKLSEVKNNYLNISCEPTLTMRWLMPRMSDFYQTHANSDIRLSTSGGPVTLADNELSLAIRRDDFALTQNYRKQHLVDEWVGPVFSPEYWQQVKDDFKEIKLIHSDTRSDAWLQWITKSKQLSLLKNSTQSFAHFYFCFQAAVDGLGAALGSYPLVADDLKRGKLIAPFGFVPSGNSYIILSQQHTSTDALETEFIQWLKSEISQCIPTVGEQARQ